MITKWILRFFLIFIFTIRATYSLTLDEAVQETLYTNPDILSAMKDHDALTEVVKQAKAGFYPKVKLNFGYGPDNQRNSNTSSGIDPFPTMPHREEGIMLDQSLFDGFATTGEVKRNRARVSSAAYKILSTVEDAMEKDVEVYLAVLREQELLDLTQVNVAFHQKIMDLVSERTQSGVSELADLYQAQGRLSLAKSNLVAEASNLSDAKANFYRAVGVMPARLVMPPPPDPRYVPGSVKEAIDIGIKNNPVVQSASADINSAIAQHEVAKAANYPKVNLQLSASRDHNEGGVRGPSFDQYVMLRVTYDLFSGGADVGRQTETAYQIQQAKEIKKHAIRQLVEAVRLSWDSYFTAENQLPWLFAHHAEALRTVNAYSKEYQIGKRRLLDLLDGQNELFAADRAYITGKYEILIAQYRMLRDMGILIHIFDISFNQDGSLMTSSGRFGISYDNYSPVQEKKTHLPTAPKSETSKVNFFVLSKTTSLANLNPKLTASGKNIAVEKLLQLPTQLQNNGWQSVNVTTISPELTATVKDISIVKTIPPLPVQLQNNQLQPVNATKFDSKLTATVKDTAKEKPILPLPTQTQTNHLQPVSVTKFDSKLTAAMKYVAIEKSIPTLFTQQQNNNLQPATAKITAKPNKQAWEVQVGAFKNENNSKNMIAKLQSHGYNAYVHQTKKQLTVVSIGPENDLASAKKLLTEIRNEMHIDGYVVSRV